MNEQGSYIAAVGGHLVDLWRTMTMDFANPHSLTKLRCLNSLRRRTGAKVFVETGTYLGNTAYRASWLFDRVFTIELDHELARKAGEFLARRRNVRVIEGDALHALPQVFEDPSVRDAVVFLDGHYSAGDTACGELQEPAVEEIRSLGRYKDQILAIQVDDFRLFGLPGFPSKSDLLKAIEDSFGGDFQIEIQFDQVMIVRRARVS
jgi:hypothetical protein